jgi:SAM-dependent methyltransferase
MHFLLRGPVSNELELPRLVEDRPPRASAPVPGGEPGPGKRERCTRRGHAGTIAAVASPYDTIAELYDPWSASVVEDVGFYREEARRSGGPVVELGVGTGRIAVPLAADGIHVIGVDSSRGMLDVCARRAALAGVDLDLRVGDLRRPPVEERVPLVICPFRSLLHMQNRDDRLEALGSVRGLLVPGGRFAFDVFAPGAQDIRDTHDRWLEREPGIFERARWDEEARTLTLTVRGSGAETTMALSWLTPDEWRGLLDEAGFEIEACYGWFDRTPYAGGEDTVWIVRVRSDPD